MKIYLQYMILDPKMENRFAKFTHKKIYHYLQSKNLSLVCEQKEPIVEECYVTVVTTSDIDRLSVRGPEINNTGTEITYAVYLPSSVANFSDYIQSLAKGFSEIFIEFSTNDFLSACGA